MTPTPAPMDDEEAYWHREFMRTEGRPPSCAWELMTYAVGVRQISAQNKVFWKGVLGL